MPGRIKVTAYTTALGIAAGIIVLSFILVVVGLAKGFDPSAFILAIYQQGGWFSH